MIKRLDIGISIIQDIKPVVSFKEIAKKLVKNALISVDFKKHPIRFALLLATLERCKSYFSMPSEIRREFEEILGYSVPLIGGSMAALYCSTENVPFIKQGLMLIVFCSDYLWVTVSSLKNPYDTSENNRKLQLLKMAKELRETAGVRLGSSANRYLFGFLPGIITDRENKKWFYDNELCQKIVTAFDNKYLLFGVASADSLEPKAGYQFANDKCLKSGLALALIESDLRTGTILGHGFTNCTNTFISVDELKGGVTCGYEVTKFDGEPAIKRLLKLQKTNNFKMPIWGLKYGSNYELLTSLNEFDEKENTIRLDRKISLGDRLYMLDASKEQMFATNMNLIQNALSIANADVIDLGLLIEFSGINRYQHYIKRKTTWQTAIEQLRQSYKGVPIIGAVCAGEFGLHQSRRQVSNTMGVLVSCITNIYSNKSKIRELQNRLLTAAFSLSECQTPKEVMQKALEGAVEAGATGGQICLVEEKIGRILGKQLGYAFQHNKSPHNWLIVSEMTDRPAPKKVGGNFPLNLMDWSISVTNDIQLHPVTSINEEDILTLIVRTLRAIFVTDSMDPKFFCNKEAIKAGNIQAQLAIPLIGSKGKAIATLQLSFHKKMLLDRESFGLWIAYAQKIAAALEMTQETEERQILEEISKIGNKIMQTPINMKLANPEYEWCDDFLNKVTQLLGADGAHMRILFRRFEEEEYRLVSAVGYLASIRKLTRPVTREGDGSCNIKILKRGGIITNCKDETAAVNRKVGAIENTDQLGDAFIRLLEETESTVMLPLYHRAELLGSFVIDSKRRYFFTERWERIARYTANLAGTIILSKKEEYQRSVMDTERSWMLETLTLSTTGTAKQLLDSLLDRIRTRVQADVASVYVWYATPRKLVLYAEKNWFKPLIGKAIYDRGEGWTGSLLDKGEKINLMSPRFKKLEPGKKKYYEYMVPPEYRVPKTEADARIGFRLRTIKRPLGVVIFSYYKENTDRLCANDERFISYLRAFSQLLAIGVEASIREESQKRVEKLVTIKNDITGSLFAAAERDEDWQSVMEKIREGFEVERVTLYKLQNGMIEHAWTSKVSTSRAILEMKSKTEPFGPLGDIVKHKEDINIKSKDDPLLNKWPNKKGVRTVYAVPVLCTEGDVQGVLEFVNRIATNDHPYEILNEYEQNAAQDVALLIGAALDHIEHEKQTKELGNRLTTAIKIASTSLFGGIVIHRLLHPFGNIQSHIDWLRLHPKHSEKEYLYRLQRIEQYCSDAVNIISQTAHSGPLQKQHLNIKKVVDEAVNVIRPEISSTNIKLCIHNSVQEKVYIDHYAVIGALVNILSNAIDAMKDSGTLTITTGFSSDKENIIIKIHNTGPKYKNEEVKKFLMSGFTTKRGNEHLGIGLPISQQAIEAEGGNIEIISPLSGGVLVKVKLPISNINKRQEKNNEIL